MIEFILIMESYIYSLCAIIFLLTPLMLFMKPSSGLKAVMMTLISMSYALILITVVVNGVFKGF